MEIEKGIKKASLLYNDKFEHLDIVKEKSQQAPLDKFYCITLFFFFSGIAGSLPVFFFVSANDYWMHKLRDTANDDYNLNEKTELQRMFVSANSIATSLTSAFAVTLAVMFSHKFKKRNIFCLILGCMSLIFGIFTLLVVIDTDTWQTLFFGLVMCLLGSISFLSSFFVLNMIAYLSKFPPVYLKRNIYGTSVGGLFGSTLQTICLSIGDDTTTVALIYFTSGTVVVATAFLLSYLIRYTPVTHFYEDASKHTDHKTVSLREFWEAAVKIWPLILIMVLMTGVSGLAHPNISSLIVSEGYTGTKENLWFDKYFPVVAVYFLYDIFQVIGQIFVYPIVTRKNYPWALLVTVLRCVLVAPLFLFCNAQPRTLPVWFPHDYQFMIIMAVYSISFSVIFNSVIISTPNFTEGKAELSFMVIVSTFFIANILISLANPFIVKLLGTK